MPLSEPQASPNVAPLPSGTVTFLFTDIEGSTRLLERLREQYTLVLEGQRHILRRAFDRWNGHEIDTQGDSFFIVFPRAIDALCCAIEAQKELAEHAWPEAVSVHVRMGLHTGEPFLIGHGEAGLPLDQEVSGGTPRPYLVGMDVHRAARIAAAGYGGQVLLSQTTRDLVYMDLPARTGLRDLGSYKLKDIRFPQQIYQLEIDGLPVEFPPLKTLSADEEPPTPGEPPYKGLQFFDEADAAWFFGRQKVVERLVQAIQQQRFLAVIGASGSGKSSTVRAGLVPALKRLGTLDQVFVLTPTVHPLEALSVSLTRNLPSVAATAALIDDLRRDPRSLHLYLQKTLSASTAALGQRILLVIDQFEELITQCRSQSESQAFVDNLLYAVEAENGLLSLVIVQRADFYQHLAQYDGLRQLVAKHQEYLGAMGPDELRQAIEEPAQHGGWEFSPGLVDLMLSDVGLEPGALPLLSHALLETWNHRRGNTLVLRGYFEAGGVRGAIARTAERVYNQELSAEQKPIARSIFLRLTELGEGTQDTSRRVKLSELVPSAQAYNPQQVHEVLNRLADARLVTLSEDKVEVAHEALIREWPALKDWLAADREGLRIHRHLTDSAQEWSLLERDPGALYRGSRLVQAQEWSQSTPGELNAVEQEFLQASIDALEAEQVERELQRQRELEAARKLAEAERQRAEEQVRSAARLRRRAWLLLGVLCLTVILAFAALILGQQASQRASLATSRELANAAVNNLAVDPERSVLLALQALGKSDTLEARNALHQALPELHILRSFVAHDVTVTGVAYSPDGKLLASSSADRTTKIWNSQTDELLHTLKFEKDTWDVDFSPDGKILATSTYTQVVGFDPQTGQQLFAFKGKEVGWKIGFDLGASRVDFSPDGKLLAVANMDGHPVVWNIATQAKILTLSGHKAIVRSINFSPSGKLLATGSDDGTVRVWDVITAQQLVTLTQTASSWFGVQFSPDGSRLAAVSEGSDLKVWEVEGWKELMNLARPEVGGFRNLAWSPDGKALVTAGYDGVSRIWDAASGQLLVNLPGHISTVADVDFSPDGKSIVSGGVDHTIKVWDAGAGRELVTIKADSDNVRVAYSPDGSQLATTGVSGKPKLWEAASGQLLRSLPSTDPPHMLLSVAYSPDGKRLAAGSVEGIVTLWDLETGQVALSWPGHSNTIAGIAFSPDGKRLATSSHDGMVKVWNADTGDILTTFDGHARHALSPQLQMVFSVAFSPDGQRVASAGFDGAVRVWDSKTGTEIYSVSDGKALFSAVGFSPDGKLLAAGEFDSPLLIVDAATGTILHKSTGHSAAILDLRFSPDSKLVATASFDRLAKLWDAASGQELSTYYGNAKNVWSVSFTPDGKRVAVGGWDGTARIFVVPLDELKALAKSRLTRSLTTEECQKYLHVEQCP